jgi:hypothetical protein
MDSYPCQLPDKNSTLGRYLEVDREKEKQIGRYIFTIRLMLQKTVKLFTMINQGLMNYFFCLHRGLKNSLFEWKKTDE